MLLLGGEMRLLLPLTDEGIVLEIHEQQSSILFC